MSQQPTQRSKAAYGTKLTYPCVYSFVRFSNRPFRVKRFQTIHHYSVDVAHGLVLLFGIGTSGPSIMGFEDEVKQSIGRPCRQTNGRSKRTCELTSSIVPRGTSFHRSVRLNIRRANRALVLRRARCRAEREPFAKTRTPPEQEKGGVLGNPHWHLPGEPEGSGELSR